MTDCASVVRHIYSYTSPMVYYSYRIHDLIVPMENKRIKMPRNPFFSTRTFGSNLASLVSIRDPVSNIMEPNSKPYYRKYPNKLSVLNCDMVCNTKFIRSQLSAIYDAVLAHIQISDFTVNHDFNSSLTEMNFKLFAVYMHSISYGRICTVWLWLCKYARQEKKTATNLI